jgi:hypothetical protein
MKEWWRLAKQRSVVKRALKSAAVVGCLLIAINHSDALLKGDVSLARLFQMLLTTIVPYTVSTVSSVAVIREREPQTPRA